MTFSWPPSSSVCLTCRANADNDTLPSFLQLSLLRLPACLENHGRCKCNHLRLCTCHETSSALPALQIPAGRLGRRLVVSRATFVSVFHPLLVKDWHQYGRRAKPPRRDMGSLEGATPFVNRGRVCLLSLGIAKSRDLVHEEQIARPMQSSLFLDLSDPNVLYLSRHAVIRGGGAGGSDSIEAATKLRDSRHASETFLTVPIGLSGF